MPKRMALLVVGLALANIPMPGQGQVPRADGPAPSFVVISVKPTAPFGIGARPFLGMPNASQFVARNQTLKALIAEAYNLTPQEISGGPTWVDFDHYDILADALGEFTPTRDEQMSMLRTILANRFKLTFHHEQKELPIYTLTLAKSGSKLKESTMSPDASSVQGTGWSVLQGTLTGPPPHIFIGIIVYPESLLLRGSNAAMADLASVFQRSALDRPVVDKTGLSGKYNFDLRFTPDESQFGGKFREMTIDNLAEPALFIAIQEQLGLKLEPTKGPVDTIVIDHIDRPSSN